ncbi:MAG: hypothetical protein HQK97_04595 [Nitrospirae bacterium]|nr:hypothetical protein [Nitrospirota bacterium]
MGAKGKRKTGGRPKGAKNKRTLDLENKLKAKGFDPVEILVGLAIDPKTDGELRAKICLDMLKYFYPRRKAVETTVDAHVETYEAMLNKLDNETGTGNTTETSK